MGVLARRQSAAAEHKPVVVQVDDRIRESARAVLPFRLTNGQKQALKEIVDDLQRPQPMNRLLQGDVGAGKTIVALLAALVAMENGLQVAFMAPTEILAEQHFANISQLLLASRFRVALLTGSTASAARRTQLAEVESGAIHLVVGTHALVEGDVRFKASSGWWSSTSSTASASLQRATLRAKGLHPDVLVMTATPIPRTLALTLYGDLDVSMIRELPAGRLPIKTAAKPESRRDEVYQFIREQLDAGRQAYVIYPLVEESAKIDLKAATEMADHLAQEVFPDYQVGLLHGRMKADGKERVMKAFAGGGAADAGLDDGGGGRRRRGERERDARGARRALRAVAAASAARPRRPRSSSVVLLPAVSAAALRRGARAPEGDDRHDRRLRDRRARSGSRGPGDFFGTRQAGVPTFRLIDLVRDREVLDLAHREAARWFAVSSPTAAGRDRQAAGELGAAVQAHRGRVGQVWSGGAGALEREGFSRA